MKTKTNLHILFAFFLLIANVNAQNKEHLKVSDYYNFEIYPKSLSNLQWVEDKDAFTYKTRNALVMEHPFGKKSDTIMKLPELNKILKLTDDNTLKRFPSITWSSPSSFYFINDNILYRVDISKDEKIKEIKIPKEAENIDIEPNTFKIAFTMNNNLFCVENDNEFAITADKSEYIVNGQEVHRREFGINTGTFWSPKGSFLAFYRKDESMVTDYPLVDINKRVAENTPIKYPMAGMKSHHVTLGIYNFNTKKTLFLETGLPAEQYITSVTWGPQEKYIYLGLLNRDQDHLKVCKFDVKSGKLINVLFEEKDEKYVEPEDPLFFVPGDANHFIWMSERDGFKHLYLYDTDGNLKHQITKGDWMVTDFLGFDEKAKQVFFTSTMESPLENHIYQVDLQGETLKKLSKRPGTHRGLISSSGDFYLDQYSNLNVPNSYEVGSTQKKEYRTIFESENPLKNYALGEMDIFTLEADDGTDLYCRLIKPVDFTPGKKYPVFVYVYGGPHAQLITKSWLGGAGIFLNYMAENGYVVFTMDNRGSANRGLEFEQAIHRNLGDLEIKDQMVGIEYLKKLDYIDTNRFGIDGWSYGGFMTISMMLKNPGLFKVACAGGPVIDWKYYEIMYGERYMDIPEKNPDGYKKASLLNYVDKLEGNLLIMHGTMDPVVVWQNSLAFIKKCVDEGKQIDYFVYPGHEHNVSGRDRIHMYEKIASYFDLHMKK